MRLLTIDIESFPARAVIWRAFQQYVTPKQVTEPPSVVSFAAKWHGKKAIEFRSDFHDGHETMLRRIYQLLDEADVVAGWNSERFDVKRLNDAFFDIPDLRVPYSPFRQIDVMKEYRKRFDNGVSSSLGYVSKRLGLAGKTEHEGLDLWLRCMAGDVAAWDLMRRYNRNDVVQCEQTYDIIMPWISNHPNRALYDDKVKGGCPRCGSMEYIIRKYRTTAVASYRQYQCSKCRGYFAATHQSDRVHAKAV